MTKETQTSESFTHFDDSGNARMVDVGAKETTKRVAIAKGSITVSPKAFEMIKTGSMAKGDVLGVARIAGIMAAKKVDIGFRYVQRVRKRDKAVNFFCGHNSGNSGYP